MLRFSQRFECKRCNVRFEQPEPRLFSFNNPYGACPRCQGFGNTIDFDLDLVIPDKSKTLAEGAIDPGPSPSTVPCTPNLKRYAKQRDIPLDVPWQDLDPELRQVVVEGEGRFPVFAASLLTSSARNTSCMCASSSAAIADIRVAPTAAARGCGRRRGRSTSPARTSAKCLPSRWRWRTHFFDKLQLSPHRVGHCRTSPGGNPGAPRFLNEVGLEYLTLDRLSSTLSGGEAQRIQLATSLGSRLVGTLYVLDEPSIGLHSRDTQRLINILHDLRDLGNTILVVEHDPDIMRAADRILDLGPGAGENGGKLIAAGTYDEILHNPALAHRTLSCRRSAHSDPARTRRKPGAQQIKLTGARAHNLKGIDVEIPLGMLVADHRRLRLRQVHARARCALSRALRTQAQTECAAAAPAARSDEFEGEQFIDEVVLVDQSPIGRTPRSNPVTYIKAFDAIRELFAALPEAQKRGFSAGHFSFNIPGGRCETCQGDGTVTVEMQFLADVELICEDCKGTRYKPQVLEVRYQGKNIHEVLNLTVRRRCSSSPSVPKITDKLVSSTKSAWAICVWASPPPRSPAAKPSA